MSNYLHAFKFRVLLTRSTSLGPTASKPPKLTMSSTPSASPGTAPAPQQVGADGRTTGPRVDQTDNDLRAVPDQIGNGGFQECQGLDLEADIHDYLEGGRNDQIVRRVGRIKLQPVVLKRGMLLTSSSYADTTLWDWLRDVVAGQQAILRFNGAIEALDPADTNRVLAHWSFVRGLPLKLVGPQFNARTGELAIEELHIVHEGLRLEHKP